MYHSGAHQPLMKPRLQVSKSAVALIKTFEGYRRSAARLADGRWTIGYGHTQTAREGAEVSESDAEALLIYDLLQVTGAVNDLTFTPLTQNQYDALVSFTCNIGIDAFRESNVLRLINEGALLQAAEAMEAWRKARFDGEEMVVDALIRRRAAEKALFLTPAEGFVAAPTAVVSPRLDPDAVFAEAVVLHTPLEGSDAVAIPTSMEVGVGSASEGQGRLPLALGAQEAHLAPDAPGEAEERVSEPETDALQGVLDEVLYEIPGYGLESEFRPAGERAGALSLYQLVLLGLFGLALLGIAFYLLMMGSSLSGAARIGAYGLASVAGLAGAISAFASIYQLLNRFDRQG